MGRSGERDTLQENADLIQERLVTSAALTLSLRRPDPSPRCQPSHDRVCVIDVLIGCLSWSDGILMVGCTVNWCVTRHDLDDPIRRWSARVQAAVGQPKQPKVATR